jgi:hypothetical protein
MTDRNPHPSLASHQSALEVEVPHIEELRRQVFFYSNRPACTCSDTGQFSRPIQCDGCARAMSAARYIGLSAVSTVPALLGEVERLTAQRSALRAALVECCGIAAHLNQQGSYSTVYADRLNELRALAEEGG